MYYMLWLIYILLIKTVMTLSLPIIISDELIDIHLVVIHNLFYKFLFGIDVLSLAHICINVLEHTAIQKQCVIPLSTSQQTQNIIHATQTLKTPIFPILIFGRNGPRAYITQLIHLLEQYPIVTQKPMKGPCCTTQTHKIYTNSPIPIREAPYRISTHKQNIIETYLKEMLDKDVIEPSTSPWSSPIVLVPKANGEIRFCVDYRKLNKITIKDSYPLSRIDDTLQMLRGASIFSSLDLKAGYWKIPIKPEHREKTAFITHEGLYQFTSMPFGRCNVPATFQ